mmetsp:Transcript_124610/g.348979  ORF Transcript_124610/g.348979 Transcript_124610/m.348979 type:complete len:459 (-) Transcript_124610:24-1400(-)
MSHFDVEVYPLLNEDVVHEASGLLAQVLQSVRELGLVLPRPDVHGLPTPPELRHALHDGRARPVLGDAHGAVPRRSRLRQVPQRVDRVRGGLGGVERQRLARDHRREGHAEQRVEAHLGCPLLRGEDPVQVRLVREPRVDPGALHLHHELPQLCAVDVRGEGVPILVRDRPQEVESADVLALHEVSQQRRVDLRQLLRALDEGRDDLVGRAQGAEDVVLEAVDVVVRGRGSDLAPAARALGHGIHRLLAAPADVEERQPGLLLCLRGRAALPDLLREDPLRHHVRVVHVEPVSPPVVPHRVQPLDLHPRLVVRGLEVSGVPRLAHLCGGPAVRPPDARVQEAAGAVLHHEVAVRVLRVAVEDVHDLADGQGAHGYQRRPLLPGDHAIRRGGESADAFTRPAVGTVRGPRRRHVLGGPLRARGAHLGGVGRCAIAASALLPRAAVSVTHRARARARASQ